MERLAAAVYGDDPPSPEDATMWDVIDAAAADCECPGPPPEFLLPPPPLPPSLQPADPMICTDDPLIVETCDALPLIDASSQTLAVIALCSVLLGLLVFIAVILVWKHKRVQNFLLCKNSPQNNCDGAAATGLYEDLNEVMLRHTTPHHHHHHQLTGGHIVAPSIENCDKNTVKILLCEEIQHEIIIIAENDFLADR
ncbi:unnamed protein product [Ceutorhynchus assimilis]|uniref:Uncharacterized protein n=1 Tax=Ceutorhynchus assimilis TaxID=467358 RepID=A0A9N9MKW2_9CUCU|nr:unnamed protein product [Ceutorhynchus assimilis]